MTTLTVEDVAAFVRAFTRLSARRTIGPDTRLDADLGITGDDGDDLLVGASRHFGVDLACPDRGIARTLQLESNEHLFNPEGVDPLGIARLVRLFRNEPEPIFRDLTVAELHRAILNAPPCRSSS